MICIKNGGGVFIKSENKEKLIIDYIRGNKNLDDGAFHAFVEKHGINPHEAEEIVYKILNKKLGGTKHIYTQDQIDKVDPKELTMGIKVEMEHTDNKESARTIALDHLIGENFPYYYTHLDKMEKKMRKSKPMGIGTIHKTPSGKMVKKIAPGKWVEVRDSGQSKKTYQSGGKDEGTKGSAGKDTETADGVELKDGKNKGKKFRVKGHGKEAVNTRYHGIVGEFTGEFNNEGKPKLKIWDKIKNAFSVIAIPAPVLEMAKSKLLLYKSETNDLILLKSKDDIIALQSIYDTFEKASGKDKWISAKIKKLMDEGKPQKQAIAIAYSMWGDKSKSKKGKQQ